MLRQNQVFSHWEFTNYLLSKLFSDKTEVPAPAGVSPFTVSLV